MVVMAAIKSNITPVNEIVDTEIEDLHRALSDKDWILQKTDAALKRLYGELERKNDELERIKASLEIAVQERTKELDSSNQALSKELIQRKRAEKRLKKYSSDLKHTVEELRKANHKILEQQRSVIEEERLKALLQLSGAAAHELNQPLMVLLGNIELMKMRGHRPESYIDSIEKAGQRIAEIVKKTQDLRRYETRPYAGGSLIINLHQNLNILSVEDSDADFELIKAILDDQEDVHVSKAPTISEAMEAIGQRSFDLILLDYILPDGDGLDFFRSLHEKGADIPVIVITAQGNELIASQVIQEGAYDYLPKDMISAASLMRSISNTLEKVRLKREIRKAQKKLSEMSLRDELTKLYNRRYFMEILEREISRAKRYEADLVLCMIDLDHFKQINNLYGHRAGDVVLSEFGKMLREYIRQSDLIFRYGGEEFAIIFPNTTAEHALKVCERFKETVTRHWFRYGAKRIQVTLSMGIASYRRDLEQSPEELRECALKALGLAKKEGRNRVKQHRSGLRIVPSHSRETRSRRGESV
jgi:two-component system cell cycle response regulator